MSTKQDVAKQAQDRVQLEKERVKRQGQQANDKVKGAAPCGPCCISTADRQVKAGMTPIKAYLLLYNAVSTALWARLLIITVSFLLTNRPGPPAISVSWWSRVIATSPTARRIFSALPSPVAAVSNYLTGSYNYKDLGYLTKYTQSLAALEVVHAALGLVRSPVGTTAAQVASRLYTVWGVVEAVPSTHNSPLFATMLLAWSLTEVIRYSFYFFSLLNISIPVLNWLRYTTFYALYPLGASSEAFIAFSTLPPFANLPIPNSIRALNPLRAIIGVLPDGVKHAMVQTVWGRRILFNLARLHANAKGAVRGQKWELVDYARLGLFVAWWPALYVLFNYMVKQRKKVLGKGKTVGGVNKAR